MPPSVADLPASVLYNNCTDHAPPDWTQFDAIEVSGVRDLNAADWREAGLTPPPGNETCCEPCDDDVAEFWTVYGHFARNSEEGGGVVAITDCSTRELAERIAAHFETLLST